MTATNTETESLLDSKEAVPVRYVKHRGRWGDPGELSRRRAAAMANTELCAALLADAQRRGQTEIDWAEYFRNSGMY